MLTLALVTLAYASNSQVNYTANDFAHVNSYNGNFLFGSNLGWYSSWDDQSLADIAAGNPSRNVRGAGVKTLRPSLYEEFLESWGYDVRLAEFNHYQSLGIRDNTVFLGLPAAANHKDNAHYGGCADESNLFQNMYTPIWDGGANGTPVNENNYFALYVYKTVSRYKTYTKFWEIINEPDFSYSALSWADVGTPGNWWQNNPAPCDLANLKAPIFHYIRLLRISYEVIKTIDPTAYVATGGIGYPSFLDAVLRNTDNPVDGSVTAEYPLKGGAYFDVLSFHSYPAYDLKYWDNSIMQMVYTRHSDAAANAFINLKNTFQTVLSNYGYNGTTYPQKIWICTESNIPKKAVGGLIGSIEAQRNYILKAIVEAQRNNIRQLYVFNLGDDKTLAEASDGFQTMGLYQKLEGIGPLANGGVYNQQYNEMGISYKTASDILSGFAYDNNRTQLLNLSGTSKGAAFKDNTGGYVYVLWAATSIDGSEATSSTYSFPLGLNLASMINKREWNYSVSGITSTISSSNIALSGTPIFLYESLLLVDLHQDSARKRITEKELQVIVSPNPASAEATVKFTLKNTSNVSLELFDANGKQIQSIIQSKSFPKGTHTIPLKMVRELAGGIYYVRFETPNAKFIKKLVVAR